MSSLFGTNRRQMMPAAPPGRPIASYRTYMDAQRAVDYLSDEKFPVQHVSIVGTDLKMVERVTGRLTWARVAAGGLMFGLYWGGFIGLLMFFFDQSAGTGAILSGVLFGAAFGMLFGLGYYAISRGRRDFTSTSQIVAAQYAVWCADEHAAEATRVLGGLAGVGTPLDQVQPEPPQARHRMEGPPPPGQAPAAAPGEQAPQPAGEGVTYSEMLARKRAEREGTTLPGGADQKAAHPGPDEPGRPDEPR